MLGNLSRRTLLSRLQGAMALPILGQAHSATAIERASPLSPEACVMDFLPYQGAEAANLRLTFWTLEQWDALPEAERPDNTELIPGVGWLCVHDLPGYVPRWEALANDPRPQPEPLEVKI